MIPSKPILAFALAFALVLPGVALSAAEAQAQALPKGVTAGPSVEGISEYTLANGLRVLLVPDASKPTVTVNVVYGVGSAQENYGETGMAHLLEHLVFKGTPTHADIPGDFKKRGISFNGTTWLDRTNYFGSFPANDETLDQEHIDKWGGIHAITEAVYDCADLAQRILDAGLTMENMCAKPATSRQMILIDDLRRSLDMDDGDVEATVDPDTGEID